MGAGGVSARGAGGGRGATLLWNFHPRDIDVATGRTLEDPVKARRHPLRIVAVIVIVIIFAGGFFLRLPPLLGFSSTRI
jgi:hypothetical protein